MCAMPHLDCRTGAAVKSTGSTGTSTTKGFRICPTNGTPIHLSAHLITVQSVPKLIKYRHNVLSKMLLYFDAGSEFLSDDARGAPISTAIIVNAKELWERF
jgi:hypothetical protein